MDNTSFTTLLIQANAVYLYGLPYQREMLQLAADRAREAVNRQIYGLNYHLNYCDIPSPPHVKEFWRIYNEHIQSNRTKS